MEATQSDHDAKLADQNRLTRIRSECSASPKTITIVNPVQSLVYDDDVHVDIHLGGVPASYLGLNKDEQQRVFIFVNGQLIPPVAIALDDPFQDIDSAALRQPINVTGLPSFNPAQGAIVGKATRIQLPPQPDQAIAAAHPPLSAAPGAPPLRPSLQAAATGRALSSMPVATQRVKRDRGRAPTTAGRLGNVLAGRRMTLTKRRLVHQTLPPGISLEFEVRRHKLAAGTNTVAVVVIDLGGQRYEQVVSFGAVGSRSNGTGPRLPTMRATMSSNPAPTKDNIGVHFDTKTIEARLHKGSSFVIERASHHLGSGRPRTELVDGA